MSANVETQYRGETSELSDRVAIREKLTPAYFEQERLKIFRRSWLAVGHASDVPEPGSYVVRNLPTLKTSLLLVRGRDGRVRSFHNVCTHRGNKLVREGSGCRGQFSCGFHGWTFSPEGELLVVTDEHQFRDLDKAALGLRPEERFARGFGCDRCGGTGFVGREVVYELLFRGKRPCDHAPAANASV